MNLFQNKNVVLNSGQASDFKIECDALTDEDIETFAYQISKKIKFGEVCGVPSGGLRLEYKLKPYSTHSARDPILIVDDVLTTGGSMERFRKKLFEGDPVVGVVIFARGKCPDWITPIFQMWE